MSGLTTTLTFVVAASVYVSPVANVILVPAMKYLSTGKDELASPVKRLSGVAMVSDDVSDSEI
jgi:hypothetical protein